MKQRPSAANAFVLEPLEPRQLMSATGAMNSTAYQSVDASFEATTDSGMLLMIQMLVTQDSAGCSVSVISTTGPHQYLQGFGSVDGPSGLVISPDLQTATFNQTIPMVDALTLQEVPITFSLTWHGTIPIQTGHLVYRDPAGGSLFQTSGQFNDAVATGTAYTPGNSFDPLSGLNLTPEPSYEGQIDRVTVRLVTTPANALPQSSLTATRIAPDLFASTPISVLN